MGSSIINGNLVVPLQKECLFEQGKYIFQKQKQKKTKKFCYWYIKDAQIYVLHMICFDNYLLLWKRKIIKWASMKQIDKDISWSNISKLAKRMSWRPKASIRGIKDIEPESNMIKDIAR